MQKGLHQPSLTGFLNSTCAILLGLILLMQGVSVHAAQNTAWPLYLGYINYLSQTPQEVKQAFYFRADTRKRHMAITFDDGPIPNTKKLVDLLIERNVPATFFVIGSHLNATNAQWYKHPLLTVGLHTHNHDDYRKMNKTQQRQDIASIIRAMDKHNLPVDYFRPAYGVIDATLQDLLHAESLQGILWSLDSLDWNQWEGKPLVDRVLDNLHPGAIVLFHDPIKVQDIDAIIRGVHERGYEILGLKALLQNDSVLPY